MSIAAEIRSHLTERGLTQVPGPITDDYPLLEQGGLDSLGVFQLITHLEEQYGIQVNDDEAVPDNFGSISAISRFVTRKLG